MSNANQIQASTAGDDENALRELFGALWKERFMVIRDVIAAIALAALYLRFAERKYTAGYLLQPVAGEGSMLRLGGLGGLVSIIGVSLSPTYGSDFLELKLFNN